MNPCPEYKQLEGWPTDRLLHITECEQCKKEAENVLYMANHCPKCGTKLNGRQLQPDWNGLVRGPKSCSKCRKTISVRFYTYLKAEKI